MRQITEFTSEVYLHLNWHRKNHRASRSSTVELKFEAEYCTFMRGPSLKLPNGLDFVCNFSYEPFGSTDFGWNCVTSMEQFTKNLEVDLPENRPDCGIVCLANGARQPTYEDFSSLNITTLSNLCYDQ